MRCEKAMDPRAGTFDLTQSMGRGVIRRPQNLPRRRDLSRRAESGVRYAASRQPQSSSSWRIFSMSVMRIGLAIIALVAAIAAVYALFQALDERSAPPILIEDAAGLQPVVVDVRGAVNAPGVHELAPGARMQDAILAAGGLSPTADLSTVNLARRLRDGEVVAILELPQAGGTPAARAPDGFAGESVPTAPARLNLNTATNAELTELPGIGEVIA